MEPHEIEFKKIEEDKRSYKIGFFKKGSDNLHGIGRHVFTNGSIYEGMWKDDELNGYARWLQMHGDSYTGCWLDGKKHG